MPFLGAALGLCAFAISTARAQTIAWSQKNVSGPSPRYSHGMAYDAARGVTVVFGGSTADYVASGETWEWNGEAWTQRVVLGPSSRSDHAMAYDSVRGVAVLFGGYDPARLIVLGDTWEWNGIGWTNRMIGGPSPRLAYGMAYDSARGVTVLFGGGTGTAVDSQTWEWNGIAWTQRLASGPSPRAAHAMAYDSARGVTVLFGGVTGYDTGGYAIPSNETWEWNGNVWAQRMVSGPQRRCYHAMTYDSTRNVVVLFGGLIRNPDGTFHNSAETWDWNGTAWTQLAVSSPPPRDYHAIAYDAVRGTTVLFGGGPGYHGDTWLLGNPCGSADFNHDGDPGTDADIEAYFACLSGSCCPTCGSADFNGDGDIGTDADIDAFFRVLAGESC